MNRIIKSLIALLALSLVFTACSGGGGGGGGGTAAGTGGKSRD